MEAEAGGAEVAVAVADGEGEGGGRRAEGGGGGTHLSQRARRPTRNSLSGTMKPELPTTPSRMTPATSSLFALSSSSTESRSLYLATSVDAAAPAVTPGESARPRVITPEPAATRKESAWPW